MSGDRKKKTRAESSSDYRARMLESGWVDFRRFVPAEIRDEIGRIIARKIQRWRQKTQGDRADQN